MKKYFGIIAVALVALFIVACSGGNGPEKTAEEYLKALSEGNYDKAMELGTEQTKSMLGFIKSMSGGKAPEEKTEVKDIKCTLAGDTAATCTYCCTRDGAEDKLELVKSGEKWLVETNKENPMGGDGDMMGGDSMLEGEAMPAEGEAMPAEGEAEPAEQK